MEVLVNYSLVILEIRANQFGEYVCVASNIADTISSSARIQTEGKGNGQAYEIMVFIA